MFLENKYLKFRGLNLSIETLDGLLKHNGPVRSTTKINEIVGLKNLSKKIFFKKVFRNVFWIEIKRKKFRNQS